MKFVTEEELIENFINSYFENLSNRTVKILRELETSFGRPDIVIIEIDRSIIDLRRESTKNFKFTKHMSYIMSYLFGKPWMKLDTLKNIMHMGNNDFNDTIHKLYKQNYIEIKVDKYIKAVPSSKLLAIKRICVYEAKLSKWKYAIEQAERHLWFTKESYVLLPEVSEKVLESALCECKNKRVGLKILSDKNKISTILRSTSKGIVNSPIIWELNDRFIKGEF